jgi:mRNA-degrading endonuclease RelE of RelBE toxin-antitoxin system
MEFRIADTFTDSLARLTGDEQKAVKTAAFDLQMNPAHPSLQFHKLDKAKDARFWSVRVNADIRLIVHRTDESLLLCYVDHHEQAYQWAERRKLETHPRTGAAQLVEIREKVVEIEVPRYVEAPKPPLFAAVADETLLGYGVPREWLADVHVADEDSLLELAGHLPSEAAEALLELATGAQPKPAPVAAAAADPFEHPDALRRFRVMGNVDELARALNYPWEKWTVFLHPDQRQLVERSYAGPARVSGSAGTGKTIVALHRAVFLARTNPEARVLLTTFSDALSNALETKLRRLISNEPRLGERIEVHSMDSIGARLYELNAGPLKLASRETVEDLLKTAAGKVPGQKFSSHFLLTEWDQVVDAWQLESWEAYRDVTRLGRKTRLSEKQRQVLWTIFADVRSELRKQSVTTRSGMFSRVAAKLFEQHSVPFDFAVVDEAQDVSIAQLRFLAALGASAPNRLFFAGDLGQRIFQQPFSWKAVGIDVRGRSSTLRVNYRTSHQIRMQADRLLGPEVSDVDGNTEQRKGTVSLFNGPQPVIQIYKSQAEEIAAVAQWIRDRIQDGVQPREIGIFVRSANEIDRARMAAEKAGIPCKVLDEHVETVTGRASISTMHLAKGLEFRSVVVMACDDEVIPSQDRIEAVADDADLEEVYNTERHLLYVACTRARDHLLVTSAETASEFLDDIAPRNNH